MLISTWQVHCNEHGQSKAWSVSVSDSFVCAQNVIWQGDQNYHVERYSFAMYRDGSDLKQMTKQVGMSMLKIAIVLIHPPKIFVASLCVCAPECYRTRWTCKTQNTMYLNALAGDIFVTVSVRAIRASETVTVIRALGMVTFTHVVVAFCNLVRLARAVRCCRAGGMGSEYSGHHSCRMRK